MIIALNIKLMSISIARRYPRRCYPAVSLLRAPDELRFPSDRRLTTQRCASAAVLIAA